MSLSADQLTYARMLLADPGSDAIQSVLIQNALSGTFTVTFNGQTTTALAFNAGANDMQNALAALSSIGLGNIMVNNTAPYSLYFIGTLGNAAQPMVTVNVTNLNGSLPSALVTQVAMGGVEAFSDSELNLLYSQAGLNFYLAIAYAFRALEADLSRLNDYVAGQSQEKKSQVFAHIKDLADYYQEWAFAANQVQITRMKNVPPRITAVPVTSGVPATSLQYGGPRIPRGPWGRGGSGWPWGDG